MPYNRSNWGQMPVKDTGWGLIYRLNLLMTKIENDIENGNLDKWNLHMDRIYCNITFKNPAVITKDDEGRILDIQLSKEDTDIFTKFNEFIINVKDKINKAIKKEDLDEVYKQKQILKNLLYKKDIWLRKKMFQLDLYLKQVEHDPRKAIYGG